MKEYNITWLAEEAGLQTAYPIDHPMAKFIMAIEARAAEKEREACIAICADQARSAYWEGADACEALIRARGQE